MTLTVRPYAPGDAAAWDIFAKDALQGTFLHSRRFLSYHEDRFRDRSLMLEEGGALVGLFPAAEHPTDPGCIASHPGITFGGVLHKGALRGKRMIAAFDEMTSHYAAQGYRSLLYKAVPAFYAKAPADDDLYALFRLGAKVVRRDLSSTIDLENRLPVSQRRRRGVKKGRKSGVTIVNDISQLPEFWPVVEETLASRHGAAPVHSLDEITLLSERFPEHIRCVCATQGGRVIAGTVLFLAPTAHHAQYIASNPEGRDLSALDLLFEHCIDAAHASGARYFDFGISTEDGGRVLNEGLYAFKSEFGAGSTVHEFHELALPS